MVDAIDAVMPAADADRQPCEAAQAAQWEAPSMAPPAGSGGHGGGALTVYNEGGYESDNHSRPGSSYSVAATDYSTDNYSTDGDFSFMGDGDGMWQEYWDEQAQAKYWYNNDTGEASWTKPGQMMLENGTSDLSVASVGGGDGREWVSYLDEDTGQEYWYNTLTGETKWG